MTRVDIAALFLLSIAACAPQPSLSPDFGAAVRHNMAAQIINPAPRDAAEPPPPLDGRRAQAAVERYRAGKVVPPVGLSTSDSVVVAPAH